MHPHPHQPGLILPSSLNVRQKAAVATLCTLWFSLTARKHERVHCSCGVINFAQVHLGEIYDKAPYILYFPTETPSGDAQSAIAGAIYDNDTIVFMFKDIKKKRRKTLF